MATDSYNAMYENGIIYQTICSPLPACQGDS